MNGCGGRSGEYFIAVPLLSVQQHSNSRTDIHSQSLHNFGLFTKGIYCGEIVVHLVADSAFTT